MAQMQQGLAAWQATGAEAFRPYGLALLAEASAQVGQREEGLTLLAEALAVTNEKGERRWEAELYRLQGELLLARDTEQIRGGNLLSSGPRHCPPPAGKVVGAAGRHEPSRLWQRQGKRDEARELLARSTAGSPRALTRQTPRKLKPCSKNCHEFLSRAQVSRCSVPNVHLKIR